MGWPVWPTRRGSYAAATHRLPNRLSQLINPSIIPNTTQLEVLHGIALAPHAFVAFWLLSGRGRF